MSKKKQKYRPVAECFSRSDKIRAQHLLYEDFQQERTDIEKLVFYLWLQENSMQATRGTDENGYLGFALQYIIK